MNLMRTALGAFFTALVAAAFAISFAAIIYTGDLAQFLERGIGLTLLGATIISIIGALTLSFRGSILGPQDVPAILVSTSAASIFAGSQMPPDALFSTIACLIAVCSVSAGITSVLVGQFRIAHIARFFPFPVLAGFLATTGLFLVIASIDIAMEGIALPSLRSYLSSDAMIRWAAVVAAGILIVAGTRIFSGFLVMPIALISMLAGFYGFYAVLGFSMADLQAENLLLGPFKDGGFLNAIDPKLPTQADWGMILAQSPLILSVSAATLIGATLNASGLELQLERDFDINQEIKSTGFANILSGLTGGIPGYHVVGETLLANRLGLIGAVAGISAASGCLLLLLFGANMLTVLPTSFFAAVIAFLGIDLLYTWFWEERRRFGWSDYAVVALIPIVAISFGFLTAIAVGLMMACVLFVLAYARLDVIRFQTDVSVRRSLVERADIELNVLTRLGKTAKIIELSGFLFFGSSNSLRSRILELIDDATEIRWLVLDFRRVSGVDVSTRHAMKRIASDCNSQGVILVLTGVEDQVFADLCRNELKINVHSTLDDGIEHIEEALIEEATNLNLPELNALDEITELFDEHGLTTYAETCSFEVGDIVLSPASSSKDIYLLKSGKLCVTATVNDEQEVVVAYVRPGAVVGEMAYYSGGGRSAKIIAAEPVSLICFRMDHFSTLEADRPEIANVFHKLMARVMARRLRRTTKLMNDLGA